jgi:NAD(P)H-quinone oxidoreductase subunit 4
LATTDIYGSTFRLVTVFLAAVGLILTPIYLLSMVRQVFHGDMADQMCDLMPACDLNDLDLKVQGNQEANCFGTDCVLPEQAEFKDANPREIFIAACFLGLIIAIGCYPKVATQMYDAKTMAVNAHVRAAYHQAFPDALQGSAQGRWSAAPAIAASPSTDARGVVKSTLSI